MDRDRFYKCPCCLAWISCDEILDSPRIEPLGMTFDEGNPQFNLLYFNHLDPSCGSTFTIEVERFAPFLAETPPPEILAGQEGCEHQCTSMHDLSACHADCHWAPYRRFMLTLQQRRRWRAA